MRELLSSWEALSRAFEDRFVDAGEIITRNVLDLADYLNSFSGDPYLEELTPVLAREIKDSLNPWTVGELPVGLNAVFVRDPVLTLPGERAFVPLHLNVVRRAESLYLSYVLERLGYERITDVLDAGDKVEGGDVRYFGRELAFVGSGPRTKLSSATKVASFLREYFDAVVLVRRDSSGDFRERENMDTMHLDTFFGFGRGSAYVYKEYADLPVTIYEGGRTRESTLYAVLKDLFDNVFLLNKSFLLNFELNSALFDSVYNKVGTLSKILQELGENVVGLPMEPYNDMYGSVHCITKEL
ncbi:MAG: hypothetical protein GXO00_03335 [Candidatus Diapherotrites archaeon]|nr:hypothetical protein [Candidatus Diapherotrites archaeon]